MYMYCLRYSVTVYNNHNDDDDNSNNNTIIIMVIADDAWARPVVNIVVDITPPPQNRDPRLAHDTAVLCVYAYNNVM